MVMVLPACGIRCPSARPYVAEPVLWRASPNHSERRDGALPDLIVLHYTAMTSAESACVRLCDPEAEVSAHYLISEQGEIVQMVAETARAWHAGAGAWGAVRDVNSRSIGIELANCGDHPFGEPQMAALERLLPQIMTRWSVPPERVIAHSDMAPSRKYDPGPRFDWRRLARQGLSIWPESSGPAGPVTEPMEALLTRIGYPVAGEGVAACLAAFRLRFRPWARGAEDDTDRALAADLARRFAVDGAGAAV